MSSLYSVTSIKGLLNSLSKIIKKESFLEEGK